MVTPGPAENRLKKEVGIVVERHHPFVEFAEHAGAPNRTAYKAT